MSDVVSKPGERHSCDVGWEPRPLPDDHPCRKDGFTRYLEPVGDFDPEGTIRQCSCGKTWVGYRDDRERGGWVTLTTQWRPEGRFERWRRERKARRD